MNNPAAAPSTPIIPIFTYCLGAKAGLARGVLEAVVLATMVLENAAVLVVALVAFTWLLDPAPDATAVVF